MPAAHSTDNYSLGKGVVKFDRFDDNGLPTGLRDLGNCPNFVLTPAVEKLEHFSSREGTKTKDKTVILSKGLTAKFTLDEYDIDNLAMALFGTKTGADQINLLEASVIEGEIEFAGTNAVGPKYLVRLWKVSLNPTGDVNFIGDAWGEISFEAEVMSDETGHASNPYGTVTELGES